MVNDDAGNRRLGNLFRNVFFLFDGMANDWISYAMMG